MQRIRNFLKRPVIRTIILVFGVLFLYAFLARPVEQIKDLQIRQSYAYLANGVNGLRILDIANPENLDEVGSYICVGLAANQNPTYSDLTNCIKSANSLFIDGEYIYIADGPFGVHVLSLQNPSLPTLTTKLDLPGYTFDLVFRENLLYVASGRAGLRIIEVNSADGSIQLKELKENTLTIPGQARRLYLNQGILYLADQRGNLHVISLKNAKKPDVINTLEFKEPVQDIFFEGGLAYISLGNLGVKIYDIQNPDDLKLLAEYNNEGIVKGFTKSGLFGYLADEKKGVVIVDLTDLADIREIPKPYKTTEKPSIIVRDGEILYVVIGSDGLRTLSANVLIKTDFTGTTGEQIVAKDVVKSGAYAYLAASGRGLRILDVSNPGLPKPLGFVDTPGQANRLTVVGDKAFLADGSNGLVIVDITNRNAPLPVLGHLDSKNAVDVVYQNDFAYLADQVEGLKIIDASSPDQPSLTGYLSQVADKPVNPRGLALWSDYAFLASGDQGLRVVNILDKTIPTQISQILDPNAADAYAVAVVALNDVAAQTGSDRYAADPHDPNTRVFAFIANGGYGLQVIEVTNIQNQPPKFIPFNNQQFGITGISVDIFAYRDRAYLVNDQFGIYIFDISDPLVPKIIGVAPLIDAGYRAVGISVDGSMAYVASMDRGMRILETSDLAQIKIVGRYDSPGSIVRLALAENYSYAVDGATGLHVFDVSNPKQPFEVSFLSTRGPANGIDLFDQFAFVAVGAQGLEIISVADPQKPIEVGSMDTDGVAYDLAIVQRIFEGRQANLAYIADGDYGIAILDVTNPAEIKKLGSVGGFGKVIRLSIWRDYVMALSESEGLVAVSVVDPIHPAKMNTLSLGELSIPYAYAIDIIDNYAYIAGGEYGLVIVDISYPLQMAVVNRIASDGGSYQDVSNLSNYVYVSARNYGVIIYETTNPASPKYRGMYHGEGNHIPDVYQAEADWIPPGAGKKPGKNQIFFVDLGSGMRIIDGEKESLIKTIGIYETSGTTSLANFLAYSQAKLKGLPTTGLKTSITIYESFFQILLLAAVGFFIWLGVFALFVLPVDKFSQWENLYTRLVYYFIGKHGPVARVKAGKVIQRDDEAHKPGPGLYLIDPDSAIVLEPTVTRRVSPGTQIPQIRVAGKGIEYTSNVQFSSLRFQEYLIGVVDLRPQVRLAQNVFFYTRDGIELGTAVFCVFTLGEDPEVVELAYLNPEKPAWQDLREINTAEGWEENGGRSERVRRVTSLADTLDNDDKKFAHREIQRIRRFDKLLEEEEENAKKSISGCIPWQVNQDRVIRAVYARAQNVAAKQDMGWQDLPVFIAVEILRDLLAENQYDALYQPMHPTEYKILSLRQKFQNEMRNRSILAFRYVQKSNRQAFELSELWNLNELEGSRIIEFNPPKILRSRGIKVKFSGFGELTPSNEAVRQQFFETWQVNQQRGRDIALGDLEKVAIREKIFTRMEAERQIIERYQEIMQNHPNSDEALALQVLQALDTAAADPDTRRLIPDEAIQLLRNLRNWMLH